MTYQDSIWRVVYALQGHGWFIRPGAYAVVDGQFGSTGKGAIAVLMALAGAERITTVTTNAGPNSGHIGYMPAGEPWNGVQIRTQQLPVASMVLSYLHQHRTLCYLNGGAVIDPKILMAEATRFNTSDLIIHPCAAFIEEQDRQAEATGGPARIASTGKGVGAALARKIMREGNVVKNHRPDFGFYSNIRTVEWDWKKDIVLVETAQGFSLGVNSAEFYPHTTSRECTIAQALADARIPPQKLRKVLMAVRTFPIRVGNTDQGDSGGCYSDQEETTWEAIGVEPERTTVTNRVRRVFTWSRLQFKAAVAANEPDAIFLNFAQYNQNADLGVLVMDILRDYQATLGKPLELLLLGFGPRPEDVVVERQL